MFTDSTTPRNHAGVDAHHPSAEHAAVQEAYEVLADRWPVWADAHHLRPRPGLRHGTPRVTVVGEGPESLHEVAVVPFTFLHAGQEFRGFARGPASAPTFVVSREIAVDPPPARHRLRSFRRRAG